MLRNSQIFLFAPIQGNSRKFFLSDPTYGNSQLFLLDPIRGNSQKFFFSYPPYEESPRSFFQTFGAQIITETHGYERHIQLPGP